MVTKVFTVLVLVAAAVAQGPPYGAPAPSYGAPAPAKRSRQYIPGSPRYDFNWKVQDQPSANDYGHQEARDGYDTQGSYYVQLPDGRRQLVSYTVSGDSGYLADVQYEGEAQYPQQGYGQAPAGYSYN